MKRHPFVIVLFCLSSLFIAPSGLDALTIPASEDSSTGPGGKLTTSSNGAATLLVNSTSQAFVYFSLEDVPEGAVVRFARLRLYFSTVTSAGQGVSIHRITTPWQESSAGALPAFTQAPIASIPADRIGARRFVSVDVSSLVQDWIDNPASNEGLAVAAVIAVPPLKTASLRRLLYAAFFIRR